MLKSLREFVAFDLETTGLDRDADEIIEIGAVRVSGGRISDRMSCLIKAGKPLSALVESLTGIGKDMLADAREPQDGLGEFLRFAGTLPLVAHNSDFDAAFLTHALGKLGLPPMGNPVYDSLLLARIAWPEMDSYRLESLVERLGIPPQKAHRALPDAEQAALLWLKAEERIAAWSPDTSAIVAHVLAEGPAHWRDLLGAIPEGASAWSSDEAAGYALRAAVPRGDAAAAPTSPGTASTPTPSAKDAESAEALFASTRPAEAFASLGRAYRSRPGQARMASVVERAFAESRFLAVEAEPGTGRLLASLVPALRHARSRRRPVFVAVPGKSRLDRIVMSEVPVLKAVFGPDIRIASLKSPTAYPSARKLAGILAHPETRLAPDERLSILPLLAWLESPGDGDINGNMGFNHERNRLLWSKLASDTYASEPGGFAHAARERAARANLALIQFDLFLDDLSLDYALLPAYESILFDEAHKLPEAAQARFGRDIHFFRLKHILQMLAHSKNESWGLLAELERGAGEAPKTDLEQMRQKAFEPERQLQKFFNRIAKHAQKRRKDGENRIRYADKLVVEFNAGPEAVAASIQELEEILSRVSETRPDLAPDLRKVADMLRDFRADLDHLAHPSSDGEVFWIEDFPNPHRALIRCAPLEIGPLLAEKFYPQMDAVVFSSSALALGDDFEFFCAQIGLDASHRDRLKTALVRGGSKPRPGATGMDREGSPEPLLIARFNPVLSNGSALQTLSETVIRGLRRFPRPAFALFTHIGMLKQARALLQEGLSRDGRMVFAQHVDGSREGLLHLFRGRKDACLLGTDAFVENLGEGSPLPEIVIVTKLPFPVPTDPLVAPRLEKLQESGRNPLYDFLLPTSILKLKQELNRLPGASGRRLAIWILDPRLATEKYARFYQRGLGREALVCENEEALWAHTGRMLGLDGGVPEAPETALVEVPASSGADVASDPGTPADRAETAPAAPGLPVFLP